MSKQNISTIVSGDLIVTHLIGQINTEDVYEWFND
ncbi:TPA: STAS/SEC14 domain-containing protein, partial [Bacillus anthracis]|nr:STAS/SEC14 domain-containing protein [Bacillus anthracis]